MNSVHNRNNSLAPRHRCNWAALRLFFLLPVLLLYLGHNAVSASSQMGASPETPDDATYAPTAPLSTTPEIGAVITRSETPADSSDTFLEEETPELLSTVAPTATTYAVRVTLEADPPTGETFIFICEQCPIPPGATLVLSDTSTLPADTASTRTISTTGEIALASVVPPGWVLRGYGCTGGVDTAGEPIALSAAAFYTRENTIFIDASQSPTGEAVCYFHHVKQPTITLTATIGTGTSDCPPANRVSAIQGESVTYCYTITNTSGMTLTTHDLQDSRLGVLRGALPLPLPPGASTSITHTAAANITATHVATWTAYADPQLFAVATTSATLDVLIPEPSLRLAKTVGTSTNECAETDSVSVPQGTQLTYCYQAFNTGNITLNLHSLVDNELGPIFTGLNLPLPPGASLVVTQTSTAIMTSTNFATWNAYWDHDTSASAVDNATVNVAVPPLAFMLTVGTDPMTCAPTNRLTIDPGTLVTYCYRVTNGGSTTLTLHSLLDSQFGTLMENYAADLAPGATLTATAATTISLPATSLAVWTAQNAQGEQVVAQAIASVRISSTASLPPTQPLVEMRQPAIEEITPSTPTLPEAAPDEPVDASAPVSPSLGPTYQLFLPSLNN